MTKEMIAIIEDCMARVDISGYSKAIVPLVDAIGENKACDELCRLIYKHYTTFKSGSLALIMEKIIRQYPTMSMLHFPENPLFKVAVIRGSMDLLECYIEEAIVPYLKNEDEEAGSECYLELYGVAEEFKDRFFAAYVPCKKGMDFNGTFSRLEGQEHIALINQEDFELMDDVVEKYNTIIGRRDIATYLLERATA